MYMKLSYENYFKAQYNISNMLFDIWEECLWFLYSGESANFLKCIHSFVFWIDLFFTDPLYRYDLTHYICTWSWGPERHQRTTPSGTPCLSPPRELCMPAGRQWLGFDHHDWRPVKQNHPKSNTVTTKGLSNRITQNQMLSNV